MADKAAGMFQSDDSKSATQKAGDSASDESYMDKASSAVSDASQSVSNALGGGKK